jgi:hypothetical protein
MVFFLSDVFFCTVTDSIAMGFMTYLNVFYAHVISSSVFTVKNMNALDVKGVVIKNINISVLCSLPLYTVCK